MSTLGTQTSLYAEDRGLQVPMTLEHDNIVGTQCCDTTVPRLVRPDSGHPGQASNAVLLRPHHKTREMSLTDRIAH